MLATPSQTPESASPSAKITRGHSCVLCQQRKVKCDRQKPCSNCIKSRAECIPSTVTVPRRRRKKLPEADIAAKLRRYEHLLKTHGVKIEDDDTAVDSKSSNEDHVEFNPQSGDASRLSMNCPRPQNTEAGALFADKENTYYVENTLWENLRDEIQDPQGLSDDEINDTGLLPDPESFLLGLGSTSKNLSALHPPPVQIFQLWQTFLDNVNPLVRMFHAPTVQQTIIDVSGDLANISRPTEALVFAIYLVAVISLRNDECESRFGEPRNKLLTRYSHGTQIALINAKFLKSLNLNTLQALTLYLVGTRKLYDPHSIFVLSGVAVRIAQRLGIHRESNSPKISAFEGEMRRRTWWQIVFLDGHSSKLAGAGFPAWLAKFDTKLPLNVNDSDLSPAMKELPKEKEGVTEMTFCCMRYQVAQTLRKAGTFQKGDSTSDWHIPIGIDLIAEKDKAIDELEVEFERRFIQHCDPSIPLHLLIIYVAKSVLCTMKIMAHHPRQYPDKGASMPQREKDMVFAESLKELELDTLGHTTKSIQGFTWHITAHFQLDAFIYLLSELRHRTTGELVDRAWEQVRLSYEYRQEMTTDTKNSLYVAIGNLTLKAWQKREDAIGNQVPPPRFISVLRSQRNIPDPPRPTTELQNQESHQRLPMIDYINNAPLQFNPRQESAIQWGDVGNINLDFDMQMPDITPVDWEYWQTLLDGDLPAYNGGSQQNLF